MVKGTVPLSPSLADATARLDDLLRLASDVFFETDRTLTIRAASFRAAEIFGIPDILILGKRLEELGTFNDGHPDWESPFRDWPFLISSKGEERQLLVSSIPFYDKDGNFAGIRGAAHDVTERAAWEHRASMLSAACEQSATPLAIVTADGHPLWANAGWLSDDPSMLLAKNLMEAQPTNQDGISLKDAVIDFVPWQHELHRNSDQGEIVEIVSISPVQFQDRQPAFSIAREDVTVRRRYEEQLIRHANFDELTGLPSRLLCLEQLNRSLAAGERGQRLTSVIILGVSGLSRINDVHGRSVGDRVLIRLAARLQNAVRARDIIARLSGVEFAVMAELRDGGEAEMLANKLQAAVRRKFSFNGLDHHLKSSVGIALYPGDGDDAEAMLQSAASALRAAERTPTGLRFFRPEINQALQARLKLETDLRSALRNDELKMHYQPIVDDRGTLVAAEALMRWCPPNRAPIPPSEFIPLAEETGLITRLGLWGLAAACTEAAHWSRIGRPIKVTVNVSALQFLAPKFVDDVFHTLEQSGLLPELLELEITESLLVDGQEETLAKMRRLREAGIELAIDDFGTGYSSLSYLRRFPLTKLKIDRSFIADMDSDQTIIRAVLTMSQSLGLTVVAEGVETERQAAFLRTEGCTLMQGWLFGRDEPPEDFRRRLVG